ncbi:7214_t:CDS:1 [Acaulospora morrowiae]|uniref:7214_t:CDS:1 n=1 Tax=Acaulospora morrowiae TaxID=94023 RepID=A0A9N9G546_9GLOM|nr:7214_t:CDS:1 [Acaulospora morrowiae]
MKTFENFPSECLREIFLCLEDDYLELYNCLLVNRFWCQQVVPLLWRDPFRNLPYITGERADRFSHSLCGSYISALNEDELNIMHSHDRRHNLPAPSFQYSLYLRKLIFSDIQTIVMSWFKIRMSHVKSDHNDSPRIKLITAAIIRLILRTSCLREVEISDHFITRGILESIPSSSYQQAFSQLRNLKVHVGSFPSFAGLLKDLPKLCTHLEEIEYVIERSASHFEIIDSSVNIMSAQRNLKKVSMNIACSSMQGKILSAVNLHKESLISLSLTDIDLSIVNLNRIAECTRLESLCFYSCRGIITNGCRKLLRSSSIQLKSLTFEKNQFSDENLIATLVEKAGKSLLNLSVDELSVEIVDALVKFCPKIEELTLFYEFQDLDAFLRYFKKSSINRFTIISDIMSDATIILNVLGKHIPPNLETINICGYFDPESFEKFLSDYSHSPSTSLRNFFIKDFDGHSAKYLKALKDYARFKNTLKSVIIEPGLGITDEVLDVAQSIKELGIDVSFLNHLSSIDVCALRESLTL